MSSTASRGEPPRLEGTSLGFCLSSKIHIHWWDNVQSGGGSRILICCLNLAQQAVRFQPQMYHVSTPVYIQLSGLKSHLKTSVRNIMLTMKINVLGPTLPLACACLACERCYDRRDWGYQPGMHQSYWSITLYAVQDASTQKHMVTSRHALSHSHTDMLPHTHTHSPQSPSSEPVPAQCSTADMGVAAIFFKSSVLLRLFHVAMLYQNMEYEI